jgi:hypothetical protein
MKDYQNKLDRYKKNSAYREKAQQYFEKYWLDKTELEEQWLGIKDKIFNKDFHMLPGPVINDKLGVIILKGGIIFTKNEFEIFKSCMRIVGDKVFTIIEQYDEKDPFKSPDGPFHLKFPVDITWEEMTRGGDPNMPAFTVFLSPIRNYFVFGDSGLWGKFDGSDYEFPLKIVGFDKKYSALFHDKYKIPEEDVEDLKQWTASYGMKLPGYD